jgi:hypothetical protein
LRWIDGTSLAPALAAVAPKALVQSVRCATDKLAAMRLASVLPAAAARFLLSPQTTKWDLTAAAGSDRIASEIKIRHRAYVSCCAKLEWKVIDISGE